MVKPATRDATSVVPLGDARRHCGGARTVGRGRIDLDDGGRSCGRRDRQDVAPASSPKST
jgi:hypothetical protein